MVIIMNWHDYWTNFALTSSLILLISFVVVSMGRGHWLNASMLVVIPTALAFLGSMLGLLVAVIGLIWTR